MHVIISDTQEHPLTNINSIQADNIILLMGKTRAGKSTFINELTGSKLKAISSVNSVTEEMSYVTTNIDGKSVAFIDTVGFSGSKQEMQRPEILADLVEKFASGTRQPTVKPKITGIIFFVHIGDPAMSMDNQQDNEVFKAIVGGQAMESVILLTTHWCSETEGQSFDDLEAAEEELLEYWVDAIRDGAQVMRLDAGAPKRPIVEEHLKPERLARIPPAQLAEAKRKWAEYLPIYRENALKIVRPILRSPALQNIQLVDEATIPEKSLGDFEAGKVIIDQEERKARSLESRGLRSDAPRATIHNLRTTTVQDLTMDARKVGTEMFGKPGGFLAEKWYDLGKVPIAMAKVVSNQRQKEALDKAYENMARRNIEAARKGNNAGGPLLGIARGAAAWTKNPAEGASAWFMNL